MAFSVNAPPAPPASDFPPLRGTLLTLAGLFVWKLLATSITLASGGSGGVMAPSLFMGAALGGVVGSLVHGAYPALTAASGAYALVGMGALLAATTQAPIQAILIIFEMTRDYRIILALMIACVLAGLVSGALSKESIYTMKLARRGIRIRAGRDAEVLSGISVREAMSERPLTVQQDWTLERVIQLMQESKHNGFPVVDEQDRLVGIITLADIRNTFPDDPARRLGVRVREVMTRNPLCAYPDQSLEEVLECLGRGAVGRVPVVDRDDPQRLVGLITRSDVVNAYNRRVLQDSVSRRGEGVPGVSAGRPVQ